MIIDNKKLEQGQTYHITVKPNCSKNELICNPDNIVIKLTAPPHDNKANEQLVKFMKKEHGLSIEITKGKTSRKKVIYIKKQSCSLL